MTVMTTPRAGEAARTFAHETSFHTQCDAVAPAGEAVTALRVAAEADPNLLARVIQPMVKFDLLPRAMSVVSDGKGEMQVEFAFAQADARAVQTLTSSLRTVIGIISVDVLA